VKISIIIPTYKPGEYIWDCLNSLLNQSCGFDQFEVVVVLNGPCYPYYNNIQQFLVNSGLHYKLLHTDNIGVSCARNAGIDYVQARSREYVLFLDDDDMLSSSFIEESLAKSNDGYRQIVVSNSMCFRDGENESYFSDYITDCYRYNVNKPFNIFRYRCFFSSVCAKLIPVSVIANIRFDSRFKVGEDSLFGFKISKNVESCVLTDFNTIYYRRIRLGSASRRSVSFKLFLKNHFRLCSAYTRVYFSSPKEYNFWFFLSRVVASGVQCLTRK